MVSILVPSYLFFDVFHDRVVDRDDCVLVALTYSSWLKPGDSWIQAVLSVISCMVHPSGRAGFLFFFCQVPLFGSVFQFCDFVIEAVDFRFECQYGRPLLSAVFNTLIKLFILLIYINIFVNNCKHKIFRISKAYAIRV